MLWPTGCVEKGWSGEEGVGWEGKKVEPEGKRQRKRWWVRGGRYRAPREGEKVEACRGKEEGRGEPGEKREVKRRGWREQYVRENEGEKSI